MRVNRGCPILEGDIAHEREHLHLLFNRYFFVISFLTIKITEGDIAKRADSCKLARGQVLLFREDCQAFDKFIVLFENHGESLLRAAVLESLEFHKSPFLSCIQKSMAGKQGVLRPAARDKPIGAPGPDSSSKGMGLSASPA